MCCRFLSAVDSYTLAGLISERGVRVLKLLLCAVKGRTSVRAAWFFSLMRAEVAHCVCGTTFHFVFTHNCTYLAWGGTFHFVFMHNSTYLAWGGTFHIVFTHNCTYLAWGGTFHFVFTHNSTHLAWEGKKAARCAKNGNHFLYYRRRMSHAAAFFSRSSMNPCVQAPSRSNQWTTIEDSGQKAVDVVSVNSLPSPWVLLNVNRYG